jgi:hypothetical protein
VAGGAQCAARLFLALPALVRATAGRTSRELLRLVYGVLRSLYKIFRLLPVTFFSLKQT